MEKYILTFITLLITSLSFAQLTVRDNAYIFIDGDGFSSEGTGTPAATDIAPLFVTDDIRIEATSNIYLCNNAQIIQGTGTTGNSGTGKLSVYQEGNVNNYAYNYWASPVGEISVDNGNNRNFIVGDVLNDSITVTTSVPAVILNGWNGIASPLSIADNWLYGFSPGTLYAQWDYIGDGTPLAPGYGFTMKGSTGSSSQRYDFAGKPNSGNIDVDVLAEQYTLVGNPYPSAINAGAFIHDIDYVGGYATYTVAADGSMETLMMLCLLL